MQAMQHQKDRIRNTRGSFEDDDIPNMLSPDSRVSLKSYDKKILISVNKTKGSHRRVRVVSKYIKLNFS